MTTKSTKKESYVVLAELIAAARDAEVPGFDFDALGTFVDKEIESLEKKAETARRRAEKKKNEGDDMRETLFGLLTTEAQTIPDLLPQMREAMEDDNISAQKLTARLKQLVDLGRVEKSEVTIPGTDGARSRRVMGYSIVEDLLIEEDEIES